MTQAAASLNAAPRIDGSETRVLELPGADFSDYRWGATLDPPLPGLMDRPVRLPRAHPVRHPAVRRAGARHRPPAAGGRLRAVGAAGAGPADGRRRRRAAQRSAVRALPHPAADLDLGSSGRRSCPPGLAAPKKFGPAGRRDPGDPVRRRDQPGHARRRRRAAGDGRLLGDRPGADRAGRAGERRRCWSPATARGWSTPPPPGMLDTTGTVRFAASQTHRSRTRRRCRPTPTCCSPTPTASAPSAGARSGRTTATSRRRPASRWRRTPTTPGCRSSRTRRPTDQTVAVLGGVADIEASDYGNEVSYAPADRPFYAFDGDPTTAWSVGAFGDPRGAAAAGRSAEAGDQRPRDAGAALQRPGDPHDHQGAADLLRRRQEREHRRRRPDPRLADQGRPGRAPSRAARSPRSNSRSSRPATARCASTTGRAASASPSWTSRASRRPRRCGCRPTCSRRPAPTAPSQPLSIMLTRDRANPQEPFKTDTELSMSREFTLPTARTFGVGGTARISATTSDRDPRRAARPRRQCRRRGTGQRRRHGHLVVGAARLARLRGRPRRSTTTPRRRGRTRSAATSAPGCRCTSATPTTISTAEPASHRRRQALGPDHDRARRSTAARQKRTLHLPAVTDQKARRQRRLRAGVLRPGHRARRSASSSPASAARSPPTTSATGRSSFRSPSPSSASPA